MASPQDVINMVKENEAKFVDFRFTDTRGKEQHVTVPVSAFGEEKFENGHAFDGSSISGWKGIQASDMLLMPDPNTAYVDPFFDETTVVLTCDVVDPADGRWAGIRARCCCASAWRGCSRRRRRGVGRGVRTGGQRQQGKAQAGAGWSAHGGCPATGLVRLAETRRQSGHRPADARTTG